VSGKRVEELVRGSIESPHAAPKLQELLSGKKENRGLITDKTRAFLGGKRWKN